eukprot:CAMPEP_0183432570 /NCGR_PEP_ID=MMETSP0370-20130417/58292_1 /TAXON_ID=268820 /ORGANISM="Peridinium aciculiferum, Strain PAER-2" /LENGTH=65 /DNA_ID=CAMNT_0025618605 /DNA_START=87 /DNA_END=281 /DNA_ORIENTATION=-
MVHRAGSKTNSLVLLIVGLICVMQMFPSFSPGEAMVTGVKEDPSSFMTKVGGAAIQGATAATVAA